MRCFMLIITVVLARSGKEEQRSNISDHSALLYPSAWGSLWFVRMLTPCTPVATKPVAKPFWAYGLLIIETLYQGGCPVRVSCRIYHDAVLPRPHLGLWSPLLHRISMSDCPVYSTQFNWISLNVLRRGCYTLSVSLCLSLSLSVSLSLYRS